MSEMVERVARAIYDKMVASREDAFSAYVSPLGEFDGRTMLDGDFDLDEIARTAIEAMREPTETMYSAGYDAARSVLALGPEEHDMIDVAYRARIDAALKP